MGAKVYSDNYLLDRLKWLSDELGRTPQRVDINTYNSLPCATTYVRRFGSISKALEQIGLTTHYKSYSKDKLIKLLQRLANDLGRTPTRKDCDKCRYTPQGMTYHHKFESWNKALQEAKLEINHSQKAIPKQKLIKSLYKLKTRLGRTPNSADVKQSSITPTLTPYLRRWENWDKVLKASGMERRG